MPEPQPKHKAYQRARNWLVLGSLLLTLLMLVSTIALKLTFAFYAWASGFASSRYGVLSLYFLFFAVYSLVIAFPLSVYSGFALEHRFQLSNQDFPAWFWEWTKKQLLSFSLTMPLVLVLYALIWNFESAWWLLAWAAYAFFSLVLSKLFPVLIVPLFYKYRPIEDTTLRIRIESLARRFGFAVDRVFSLNLSKTTKKANAMFTGLGKTKRVVLGDTLLQSFSADEIESVVAHELGHCKHRDIWKQFGFGMLLSLAGFWIAFRCLGVLAVRLGYSGAADIRAFPLLCLIFFVFSLVMTPLGNAFSRRAERRADLFALEAGGSAASFVTALEKLGAINLADPEPHPLIEFFLYDHPAIGKRVRLARDFVKRKG